MTRKLLSFLIALAMGMVVMFFAYQKESLPEWVPNHQKHKYDSLKKKTIDRIDSLTVLLKYLQMKQYLDSLDRISRLKANNAVIQRLKNNVRQVSFKEYTDPMLDSMVNRLHPKPR
jgi:hypothetical protein